MAVSKPGRPIPDGAHMNMSNKSGWLDLTDPEVTSPESIEQDELLHEIASLGMTDQSVREVVASKGTESKYVKMLGLDGTR